MDTETPQGCLSRRLNIDVQFSTVVHVASPQPSHLRRAAKKDLERAFVFDPAVLQ